MMINVLWCSAQLQKSPILACSKLANSRHRKFIFILRRSSGQEDAQPHIIICWSICATFREKKSSSTTTAKDCVLRAAKRIIKEKLQYVIFTLCYWWTLLLPSLITKYFLYTHVTRYILFFFMAQTMNTSVVLIQSLIEWKNAPIMLTAKLLWDLFLGEKTFTPSARLTKIEYLNIQKIDMWAKSCKLYGAMNV